MNPPKANTTVRIAANFGPASQFANSPATFIQLKGRTDHQEGELYLQLSLAALRELADLLENDRLSATDKATYDRAYTAGKLQYDQAVKLRDQLQTRKTSFLRKFIINLFVRKSDAERFLQVTSGAYRSIKRTSEDLVRRLLPEIDDTLVFGSPGESSQSDASLREESLRGVVEGNLSVTDLPPNETIRGLNVDVHNEQEEKEVFETLNRIAKTREAYDDDDDDQTIRPSASQSRPPSPSSICTVNIFYNINQSVVSFDSEVSGTTLNVGVDEGAGSSSDWHADTNQPPSQ